MEAAASLTGPPQVQFQSLEEHTSDHGLKTGEDLVKPFPTSPHRRLRSVPAYNIPGASVSLRITLFPIDLVIVQRCCNPEVFVLCIMAHPVGHRATTDH